MATPRQRHGQYSYPLSKTTDNNLKKSISWAACAVRPITFFQVRPTTWLHGKVCYSDPCALQMRTAQRASPPLQKRFTSHCTFMQPHSTQATSPASKALPHFQVTALGSATGKSYTVAQPQLIPSPQSSAPASSQSAKALGINSLHHLSSMVGIASQPRIGSHPTAVN